MDTIFECLQEQGNHEAVQVGELEKNTEAIKVVRPKFNNAIFAKTIGRDVVDELRLRTREAGMSRTFTDTTNVGTSRWEPPVVDEDWHAIGQASGRGVEGEVAVHKAVNVRHPNVSSRGKMLWEVSEATGRDDAYKDQTYAKQIEKVGKRSDTNHGASTCRTQFWR